MTPLEKAEELIFKFKNSQDNDGYNDVRDINSAIRCALIAVYEIMKIVPSVYLTDDNEIHSGHYQYWQEVKQELEKL